MISIFFKPLRNFIPLPLPLRNAVVYHETFRNVLIFPYNPSEMLDICHPYYTDRFINYWMRLSKILTYEYSDLSAATNRDILREPSSIIVLSFYYKGSFYLSL